MVLLGTPCAELSLDVPGAAPCSWGCSRNCGQVSVYANAGEEKKNNSPGYGVVPSKIQEWVEISVNVLSSRRKLSL